MWSFTKFVIFSGGSGAASGSGAVASSAPAVVTGAETSKPPQKTVVKGGAKPCGVKKESQASKPPAKSKSGASSAGTELPKESLMGDDAVEAKLTE